MVLHADVGIKTSKPQLPTSQFFTKYARGELILALPSWVRVLGYF